MPPPLRRLLPLLLAVASLIAPARAAISALDRLVVGVVYNVFHEEYATDAEFFAQIDRDLPAIAQAGFNHVLLFPMNEWDPATRQRLWLRTDYLIRKIETTGLKFVPLMLKEEQCSHYFPIWKYRDTAERWSVHHRRDGGRNNRENVDFADPRIFPLVEDSFRAVIERYGHSPALSFYNVWNEPHYNSEADHVVARFRTWLERKYGTLAELRRAWGEDYSSWDDVSPFLNDDWNSSMPSIDWRLFRNELNGVLLGELTAALRRYDTTHPVNANPVGSPWSNFSEFGSYNTDNWQFTAHNDFNGLSYYPDAWERDHGGRPHPLWLHNLTFNTVRCAAADRGYLLTELYTNAKNGLSLDGYLDPATATRVAWSALANDAKGIIWWKWEPFRRGRQSLGRGLSRLDGSLAPRGEAVRDFATVVRKHDTLLRQSHPVPAEVGIILDQVGLLKTLDQPNDARTRTFMYESHAGLFKALDEANLPVDVLRADLGLDLTRLRPYRILFLPFQVVMRRDLAAVLTEYVRQGGHLVADARTATLDELDLAYRTSPGAGLDALFGAERIDWRAAPSSHAVTPVPGSDLPAFAGRYFREQLRLHPGTTTLAVFPDTGEPALVARPFGKGRAVLAAVPLGASYHEQPDNLVGRALVHLCQQAGALPPARFTLVPGTAGTLSLRVHRGPDGLVLYAINAGDEPVTGTITLDAPVSVPPPADLSRSGNASLPLGTEAVPLRTSDTANRPFTHAINLFTDDSVPLAADARSISLPVSLPARGVHIVHLAP